MTLQLDRPRLIAWLWWITGSLVACSVAMKALQFATGHRHIFGLVQFFDVDEEPSLPTFFSVCLLLSASLLLALIAAAVRARGRPFVHHWRWLAVGFFYLATDEISCIHENLIRPVNHFLGSRSWVPFQSWTIVAIPAVLVVFLLYVPFLRHLDPGRRWAFVRAGAVYVGGAVGMEIVSGPHLKLYGPDFVEALYNGLEEGMEMAGVVLFLDALLRHYAEIGEIVGLEVRAPAAANVAAPSVRPNSG